MEKKDIYLSKASKIHQEFFIKELIKMNHLRSSIQKW
jgi:hypothetical protein